jgi:hypothetical protein
MFKWVCISDDIVFREFLISRNPNAIDFLKKNPHMISIRDLVLNPNPDVIELIRKPEYHLNERVRQLSRHRSLAAMEFLQEPQHEHLQDWDLLSMNPFAMPLIEQNEGKVNRLRVFANPAAEEFVKRNQWPFCSEQWVYLALNKSKWAMEWIEKDIDKISLTDISFKVWDCLSANPYAVHLLERYPENIDTHNLCLNYNAIHLIEASIISDEDFCDWNRVTWNKSAIHLIRANPDKVCWMVIGENENAMELWDEHKDKMAHISQHPGIFKAVYDYHAIRDRLDDLHRELIALHYHPSRMDPETDEPVIGCSVFSSKRTCV